MNSIEREALINARDNALARYDKLFYAADAEGVQAMRNTEDHNRGLTADEYDELWQDPREAYAVAYDVIGESEEMQAARVELEVANKALEAIWIKEPLLPASDSGELLRKLRNAPMSLDDEDGVDFESAYMPNPADDCEVSPRIMRFTPGGGGGSGRNKTS